MAKIELRNYRLDIADIYLKKCYTSISFVLVISSITFVVYYFYPTVYLLASLSLYLIKELFSIRNNRKEYLYHKRKEYEQSNNE